MMALALPIVEKIFSTTYRKAMASGEVEEWKDEDMKSPHMNSTYELVKLPKEKVIRYKWMSTKRYDPFSQ